MDEGITEVRGSSPVTVQQWHLNATLYAVHGFVGAIYEVSTRGDDDWLISRRHYLATYATFLSYTHA